MKRRKFLAASFAAPALVGAERAVRLIAKEGDPKMAREYYELRLIHLRRGPQVERMNSFLREALIPALNRAGVRAVGAFEVAMGPDSPTIYLLAPFSSLDAWAETDEKIAKDDALFRFLLRRLNQPHLCIEVVPGLAIENEPVDPRPQLWIHRFGKIVLPPKIKWQVRIEMREDNARE